MFRLTAYRMRVYWQDIEIVSRCQVKGDVRHA